MASVAKREWTHKGVASSAWVVRYTDRGGKQRSKQFEKKKEADRYRTQVETELEKGLHIVPSESQKISTLVREFLEQMHVKQVNGVRVSRGYLVQVGQQLHKYVLPHMGGRLIRDLTFNEIDDWMRDVLMSKGLKPSTIKRIRQTFGLVVSYAVRRGYVARNLVSDVSKDYRMSKKTSIRVFSREQMRSLLDAVDDRPFGLTHRGCALLRCMVYLSAFCGLRRGEILALRWCDIDFGRRIIHVRHNLTVFEELKDPKSQAGIRDVPMPSKISALLSDWQQYYVENDKGLIFRTAGGGAVNVQNFIAAYWKPLQRRAGLITEEDAKGFHFHALRHFAASLMIERGFPITDVASLMGHSTFDMTLQVYAHPMTGGHRRFEVMETMLGSMDRAVPALPTAQELRNNL